MFREKNLIEFWISVNKLYSALSSKVIRVILPFASSWFCEFGFSRFTEIKSNQRRERERERLLTNDDDMRACLSTFEPLFCQICSHNQAHPSHYDQIKYVDFFHFLEKISSIISRSCHTFGTTIEVLSGVS